MRLRKLEKRGSGQRSDLSWVTCLLLESVPTRKRACRLSSTPAENAETIRIICDGFFHEGLQVEVEVLQRVDTGWVGRAEPAQREDARHGLVGQMGDPAQDQYRFWCPQCWIIASGPQQSLRPMMDTLAAHGVSEITLESMQFFIDLYIGRS